MKKIPPFYLNRSQYRYRIRWRMKYSIFLAFAFLMKNGLALPNYPPPASNGYGSNQKCTYVDEVEYTEKCEEYLGIKYFLDILLLHFFEIFPWAMAMFLFRRL